MKKLTLLLVLAAVPGWPLTAEQVSVPWPEFKKLYGESIEREVMKAQARPTETKPPLVYTIEEAVYRLDIGKEHAQGDVLVSGKIVSGAPAPIPLFDNALVIAKTKQITGGALLARQDDHGGIAFLPDRTGKDFQLVLSFLVRIQEDSQSRIVSFAVPHALKNSLSLKTAAGTTLLEEPGIADADGVYHFSPGTSVNVRFLDPKGVSATALVDIDTFSRIRVQGRRAMISTTFVPVQRLPKSFILQVQDNAQYVSSSLTASWIKELDKGSYQISIPSAESQPFSIQFAVDETADAGGFALILPGINGNNGREGDFVLEEPDDGEISLTGKGLVSDIPIARLNQYLTQAVGKSRAYVHLPPRETLTLNVRRFKPVSTHPLVLDTQYFFLSFDESGSVLSVLVMDIPPGMGPRLKLNSTPNTKIWSLTVNRRKRTVYAHDDNTWVIPLEDGTTSHVQLALLHKGPKLGLHGRLEAMLPETGLPARTLRVGIALPSRVQLLSLEGPINPIHAPSWETPTEFVGNPHFFSRSFYEGQGMKLAISYKEPVQ